MQTNLACVCQVQPIVQNKINFIMKNKEIILKVKAWLEQKPEERDLQAGALLVLQLTNNRIMYNNFTRRPQHYASRIEYELQKKYNFYVKDLTHDEVLQMGLEVEAIVKRNHLDKEPATPAETPSAEAPASHENQEFKKGKRLDHDSLPEEIQSLYAANLSIMQRMRMLHTKLQLLSTENSTCPDSERYPFLKELIDLDKQYHQNWYNYDHFVLSVDTTPAAPTVAETEEPAPAQEPAPAENAANPVTNSVAEPTSEPAPEKPKKTRTRKTQTKAQ